MALCACDEAVPPTAPSSNVTVIQQVNTNIGTQPSPAPGATPDPSVTGFDEIRVGIFGHNVQCPNPPRNGENIVRLGCTAYITATPKRGGVDVPPSVHGPFGVWYLNGQPVNGNAENGVVTLSVQSNAFNIDAFGRAPGSFTLEAEVKGVRSGVKGFRVE